jgi:hypothetical protein
MRVLVVIALLLGIVATGAVAAGNHHAAPGKAQLRLVRAAPLAVRGARFEAGEAVRLVVVARARTVKRVVADGRGRFVARFGDVFVDRCEGVRVIATGALGSRAAVKLPSAYCPPPL